MTTTFNIYATANTIAEGDQIWFDQLCAGMKAVVEKAGFVANIIEEEVAETEFDNSKTAIRVTAQEMVPQWNGIDASVWIRRDGSYDERNYIEQDGLIAAIREAMWADKVEG